MLYGRVSFYALKIKYKNLENSLCLNSKYKINNNC